MASIKVEIAAAVEAMEFEKCVGLKAQMTTLTAELAAVEGSGGGSVEESEDSAASEESEEPAASSLAIDQALVEQARSEIRLDMDDAVIELDFDRAAEMRNLLADLDGAVDVFSEAADDEERQAQLDLIEAITEVWSAAEM